MNRVRGLLNRSKSSGSGNDILAGSAAPVDSPEANAARSIRLFCESATDNNNDENVLHLPVIVEAAESSPTAASAAAQQIKRFLSRDYAAKPHIQYNAIMLMRILADNPGATFTRCFDNSFVKTIKDLIRMCKDPGTQQILREALDSFEVNKLHDQGVQGLIAMWRREKDKTAQLHPPVRGSRGPGGYQPRAQANEGQYNTVVQRNQLPPAHELASRIEEARNTAKILLQLIQQTPPEGLVGNELVREFSERCQSAQKSMQVYINCDSPPPDDDTMLTLIETNEQLSLAGSRYQRAILTARRQLGQTPSGTASPEAMNDGSGAFTSPPAAGQSESLFRPATQETSRDDSPVSPILQHHGYVNGHGTSNNGYGSSNNAYQMPPGPPPGPPPQQGHHHTPSTISSYSGYPTQQTSHQPYGPSYSHGTEASDPFQDPVEHHNNPPPLAMTPPPALPTRKPMADSSPTSYTHNTSLFQPSNPEPKPPSDAQPTLRPGIGPYHNSDITPSYLGRQTSAADGLTMHGAGNQDNAARAPVEIDGYSNYGRNGTASDANWSGYDDDRNHTVSPIAEERTDRVGRRISRVDVLVLPREPIAITTLAMSWFSAMLETSTVIDAPPEKVRDMFLDFDNMHAWHTDFIKSTTVTRPPSEEAIPGRDTKPGDTLAIESGGMVGMAEILENGPLAFSYAYTGRKMGLEATRTYRFLPKPSTSEGSGTLFKHVATWEGYAAVMFMAWSPIRLHVRGLFEGFHDDLKRAVESEKQ